MNKFLAIFVAMFLFSTTALAEPTCQQQKIEKSVFEMCLIPSSNFQHDLYTLKVDGVLIFSLVDDFAERISLDHTLPEVPAIEFALSRQGGKTVQITGGCVPISKEEELGGKKIGIEVARLCNFYWGRVQVVKDVRFDFK
jgi:hypothetical protein